MLYLYIHNIQIKQKEHIYTIYKDLFSTPDCNNYNVKSSMREEPSKENQRENGNYFSILRVHTYTYTYYIYILYIYIINY